MADTKLADLTALTAPSGDDLLYIVDDPAGTPLDRKIALDNLFTRGTVTVSSPVIDAAQTWNDAGTTFTAIKMNATDTASAAGSLLMDLQVGGTSRARFDKIGNLVFPNSSTTLPSTSGIGNWAGSLALFGGGQLTATLAGTVFNLNSSVLLSWASDTILTRRAAANLRFGAADAAAPVAQTLSVQSVVAGTTNTAGANLTITGSQGTGTGAGGSIIFQVAPAGSSGTAQNALVNALTINPSQAVILGGGFNQISAASGSSLYLGANGYRFGGQFLVSADRVVISNDVYFGISSNNTSFATPDVRLYRDDANTLALRNGANAQAFRVYNTYTDASNYERGKMEWASNVLRIGTEKAGTGTARNIEFQTDGTTRVTLDANALTGNALAASFANYVLPSAGALVYSGQNRIKSSSDGVLIFLDAAQTGFGRLQFGGTTSSFPALKRSTTSLQARLADDSAFTNIQGKLTTDTAYTATIIVPTGYLTLYDSTGTAYRVPCVV